ncbi:cytochrome b [Agarivorans sp. QJM3NY_33]|uniref:cytochrome b n=1 Tax=Agarivorans sp. QJM3NY_33 TaxID=3421432 RepID=UPI003D7D0A1D
MKIKNSTSHFGMISKLFHWLMAALFIAQIGIALYMDEMQRGPDKWEMIGLHKAIGVLLLLCVLARIVWHRISAAPVPLGMGLMLSLAKLGHHALYLLMLIMPISGVIMSVSGGHNINFFDFFTISGWAEKSPTINSISGTIHEVAATVLYLVLAAHILAALYHHFVVKDETLKRITSG